MKDSGRIRSERVLWACSSHGPWQLPPEWVHLSRKNFPMRFSERLKTALFQADVLPFTAERNIRHTLQPKQWRARNAAHNCLSVQSSATNAERSSAMYARAAVPKSFKGVCSAQTADKSYNKIKMFICERVDIFCQPVCNYINARVSTNHLPSSTKKSRV